MGYPDGYPGTCAGCGARREVDATRDAAFCPACDEWQSPRCAVSWCDSCRGRPDRPSRARDLDLAPHQVDPTHDLHLADEAEVLRRLVLPAVLGTLPYDAVRDVRLVRAPDWMSDPHWPNDVPVPDDVFAEVTLVDGEQSTLYLDRSGWVDASDVIADLVDKLEDLWCESAIGWGERVVGSARALPAGP